MTVRMAFLADVHSNLPALRAVLSKIDELGIDEVAFAGDLVGYYPWPNEVTETISKKLGKRVMGNHDYSVLSRDFTGYDPMAEVADRRNIEILTTDTLEYLKSLKQFESFSVQGLRVYLVHGSPRDPLFEYVYPEQAANIQCDCDVLALGHTHVQFLRRIGQRYVINPGSVGQPRDGDPRAAFAVMDVSGASVKFELYRVSYDVKAVAEETLARGYPAFLAERLFSGIRGLSGLGKRTTAPLRKRSFAPLTPTS